MHVTKITPSCLQERAFYQQQICKPGSVLPPEGATSIINLALPLLTGLNNLPISTTMASQDTGTSSSAFETYLVFQLLRFTIITSRPAMS